VVGGAGRAGKWWFGVCCVYLCAGRGFKEGLHKTGCGFGCAQLNWPACANASLKHRSSGRLKYARPANCMSHTHTKHLCTEHTQHTFTHLHDHTRTHACIHASAHKHSSGATAHMFTSTHACLLRRGPGWAAPRRPRTFMCKQAYKYADLLVCICACSEAALAGQHRGGHAQAAVAAAARQRRRDRAWRRPWGGQCIRTHREHCQVSGDVGLLGTGRWHAQIYCTAVCLCVCVLRVCVPHCQVYTPKWVGVQGCWAWASSALRCLVLLCVLLACVFVRVRMCGFLIMHLELRTCISTKLAVVSEGSGCPTRRCQHSWAWGWGKCSVSANVVQSFANVDVHYFGCCSQRYRALSFPCCP